MVRFGRRTLKNAHCVTGGILKGCEEQHIRTQVDLVPPILSHRETIGTVGSCLTHETQAYAPCAFLIFRPGHIQSSRKQESNTSRNYGRITVVIAIGYCRVGQRRHVVQFSETDAKNTLHSPDQLSVRRNELSTALDHPYYAR